VGDPAASPLTNRRILTVFAPLAASWLMMAAELPICTAVVNRGPDPELNAAALLGLVSMALFIESPVIDLLTTSTTLGTSAPAYRSIRRFTLWLMALTGFVHALVALTPLYDLITQGLLRWPQEVSEAARAPMVCLIPWSPAIGWRRHVQGMLIRAGQTRVIGIGTGLRMATIALVSIALFQSGRFSGVMVAALALVVSVIVEAGFIELASRRPLRSASILPHDGEEIEWKALVKFHWPLTAATLVFMATLPVTSSALAQSPDRILAMAAWQTSLSLGFPLRTIVFALPEVVISLSMVPRGPERLFRFCLSVGGCLTGLALALAALRMDERFFTSVMGAPALIAREAHRAILLTCALPLIQAATGYLRGMLTARLNTMARLNSTIVQSVVLVLGLGAGLALGWPGVVVAALAVVASVFAEWAVLGMAWSRSSRSA
jgi:hypothetical protein